MKKTITETEGLPPSSMMHICAMVLLIIMQLHQLLLHGVVDNCDIIKYWNTEQNGEPI